MARAATAIGATRTFCPAQINRGIPAPLLKGGGKTEPDSPVAHTDRKIQMGRGAFARKTGINMSFLAHLFCPRLISELSQTPGFFWLQIVESCRLALFSTGKAGKPRKRFGDFKLKIREFFVWKCMKSCVDAPKCARFRKQKCRRLGEDFLTFWKRDPILSRTHGPPFALANGRLLGASQKSSWLKDHDSQSKDGALRFFPHKTLVELLYREKCLTSVFRFQKAPFQNGTSGARANFSCIFKQTDSRIFNFKSPKRVNRFFAFTVEKSAGWQPSTI